MERPRRIALLLLISTLAACAEQTGGDLADSGGSTPVDAPEQDAAVDDQPAPIDDVPDTVLDPVDTSVAPDVTEVSDTSEPPDVVVSIDVAAPLDVTVLTDTGSSELDTGALDVARVDAPPLDVPRLDVVVADTPIGRDVVTDAPTDTPTDTPTDVPTDGSCPSGSSLCSGTCVNHGTNPSTCVAAMNLGSYCGDTSCGTFCPSTSYRTVATRTGTSSQWFRARAVECSYCAASLVARVNLTVPPGVDYDLFIHRPCGTVVGRSLNLAGINDQVSLSEPESAATSDSFDYYIEVRYVSGSSCAPWTLTLEARGPDGSTC